jgi:carbonic anhydrase
MSLPVVEVKTFKADQLNFDKYQPTSLIQTNKDWHDCCKKVKTFYGRPKSTHDSEALIVHCMDHRFQEAFHSFANEQFADCGYDNLSLAGGVKDKLEVLKHVDLAVKLHHIKKVYLCNHQNCGAYQVFADENQEQLAHFHDLADVANTIQKKYPNLIIRTLYAEIKELDKKIDNEHSVVILDELNWQEIRNLESQNLI